MDKSLIIGAHTSTAGGVEKALYEGESIGATTIQFFTSNQRQWKGRPITDEMVEKWCEAKEKTGIRTTMSHDSYLINLGSPDPEGLAKSRQAFREEIERCHRLEVNYLNFHPGAALKESREQCLQTIAESLLEMEELILEGDTLLLLETTAGQGSTVGCTFEEIASIIDRVEGRIPLGVCIDTCHIFVAGYDLRTPEACRETIDQFDRVVGLDKLKAFHLNDSVKGLGSRLDRHRPLGAGEIGWSCFEWIVQDPRLSKLPLYLETPEGPPLWKKEIAELRRLHALKKVQK
ncbi:MAG: deoxyribonuclease IV [Chlamydiia bacterium]|nr:deoxyribonuclease IV [Chlamydiia bacterium]